MRDSFDFAELVRHFEMTRNRVAKDLGSTIPFPTLDSIRECHSGPLRLTLCVLGSSAGVGCHHGSAATSVVRFKGTQVDALIAPTGGGICGARAQAKRDAAYADMPYGRRKRTL